MLPSYIPDIVCFLGDLLVVTSVISDHMMFTEISNVMGFANEFYKLTFFFSVFLFFPSVLLPISRHSLHNLLFALLCITY